MSRRPRSRKESSRKKCLKKKFSRRSRRRSPTNRSGKSRTYRSIACNTKDASIVVIRLSVDEVVWIANSKMSQGEVEFRYDSTQGVILWDLYPWLKIPVANFCSLTSIVVFGDEDSVTYDHVEKEVVVESQMSVPLNRWKDILIRMANRKVTDPDGYIRDLQFLPAKRNCKTIACEVTYAAKKTNYYTVELNLEEIKGELQLFKQKSVSLNVNTTRHITVTGQYSRGWKKFFWKTLDLLSWPYPIPSYASHTLPSYADPRSTTSSASIFSDNESAIREDYIPPRRNRDSIR